MRKPYRVVVNDYGWKDPPQSFSSLIEAEKYIEFVLSSSCLAWYKLFKNGKVIKSNYPPR